MPDLHQRAIDLALRTNERIGGLFDRMGSSDAPGGRILSAYRVARRALAGKLGNVWAARETLNELRASVADVAEKLVDSAADVGVSQAETMLSIYSARPVWPDLDRVAALDAWLAVLDSQINSVRSLVVLGQPNDALILGDASRAGLLTPGPVTAAGSRWLAYLVGLAYKLTVSGTLERDGRAPEFYKQAIAAVDTRTTKCCLRVNGQIQPLDEPFKLTAEPRYADEVDNPPFHNWCRTAEALVLREFANDSLTQKIRDNARAELARRK